MRGIFWLSGFLLFSTPGRADNAELANQVETLWQANNYQAAKILLSEKVTKNTKDAQLLALLGQTEAMLRNNETAEALLEKAVKFEARNADYQHWYGTVSCNLAGSASMFSALGYAKRCKKAYETALVLAPENPRSYIALAGFLAGAPGIAGGDKDQAMTLALQLKARDELQGLLLQLSLSDIKDNTAFHQLLADKALLQNRPEPYFRRAMQLASDENYSGAIDMLKLALQQPASDDDAKASLVESRYQLARCAVLGETAITEGIAAMQYYLADAPEPARADWAKLRLAQLHMLADDKASAKAIAQLLLASTEDDKLKAELSKLL